MQPQLDKDVINLAKAIRQTESQGNFNASGASGEWGAYQFMPETWKNYSQKTGVQANFGEATPAQQNEVAYKVLKSWKDQGYNPGQIASMWNAGEGRPNAYKENFRGVNQQGVSYDTPAYAEKVARAYQSIKGQPNLEYQTSVPLPAEKPKPGDVSYEDKEPGALAELGGALNNRLGQINTAFGRTTSGEQGLVSGAVQTGGAVAGGLMDVAGAAIKAIPVVGDVVEKGEELLGKGAQAIFETPTGQELMKDYQTWSAENPTAAANIGAVANMVSVIPIFKGIKFGVDAAASATNRAFRGSLEKAAKEELEAVARRTITGNRRLDTAFKKKFDPVKTLIDNDAFPDVIEDSRGISKYSVGAAEQKLDDMIDMLDDKLDAKLAAATGTDLGGYVPMDTLKNNVLAEIKKEMSGSPDMNRYLSRVEDDFDSFKVTHGDLLTLNEVNKIKRMVRKSVKFDTPDVDKNVRYHEGQVMMRVIEDVASSRGLGDVRKLNRDMAERISAQELLKSLANKDIKAPRVGGGAISQGTEAALTAGGEAVGQSFGTPLVGGMLGKATSGLLNRKKKTAVQRLNSSKERPVPGRTRGLLPVATLQGAYRGQPEEGQ